MSGWKGIIHMSYTCYTCLILDFKDQLVPLSLQAPPVSFLCLFVWGRNATIAIPASDTVPVLGEMSSEYLNEWTQFIIPSPTIFPVHNIALFGVR